MLDHHDVRLWADHHAALTTWVCRSLADIRKVFEVLVRTQYAAPWKACGDSGGEISEEVRRCDAASRPCAG